MPSPERHLVWFLRVTAVIFLAAVPAIVMPSAWMREISTWIELGELPESALVEYLTRSVSALYAAMGASYWFMSCDVRRYLPLLRFTIVVTVVLDVILIGLDLWIPMPTRWLIGESVSLVLWTAALWWLVRRCDSLAA